MILVIIIMMIIMTLLLISYITGERKQLQLCLATKAVERLSCQEGLDDDGSHHQHQHRSNRNHRHQPQGWHSSWIKNDFLCDRCVQQLPSVQRRPTPKVSQTEKVKEDHFEILQGHLFPSKGTGTVCTKKEACLWAPMPRTSFSAKAQHW